MTVGAADRRAGSAPDRHAIGRACEPTPRRALPDRTGSPFGGGRSGETVSPASAPGLSPLCLRIILATFAAVVVVQAGKFAAGPAKGAKSLVDFDVFHIVAGMIARGELARAYAYETLSKVEAAAGEGFMPWAYPPPFDLVIAPLALLPLPLAYLAFTGPTLAAYLLVVRRIAGAAFAAVLLATLPALLVTAACGQNGFLTGTLAGLAGLGLVRSKMRGAGTGGVPLGLLAIKPHLALGLALATLALGRWSAAVAAVAVAALGAGVATLAFGPAIWSAFLAGAAETRGFLEEGRFPLFRMISAYAMLRSLGVPAATAMAAHGAVAVAVLALAWTALRRMPPRQGLGFALMTSPLLSPYAYDYDLPLAAVGLAFLMPALLARIAPREGGALLILSWIACGWGLVTADVLDAIGSDGAFATPSGALLVAIAVWLLRILRREPRAAAPSAARPMIVCAP